MVPVALANLSRDTAGGFAVLDGKTSAVNFGNCGDIIKANAGDAGYFRVAYEPALLEKIAGLTGAKYYGAKKKAGKYESPITPKDIKQALADINAFFGARVVEP